MQAESTTRREFLVSAAGIGTGLALAGRAEASFWNQEAPAAGAVALRAAPLEKVRAAFIGVGARGSDHLNQMMTFDGVEVVAVCDNHPPSLARAVAGVKAKGRAEPAAYGDGDEDYRRMLERDDFDIVIIATPWEWHARMAVHAMLAGKHAFSEVPAAVTLEECWELVDTAERTQKHCMMLENVCYGREELLALHLCRQGVLGDLLHGEAAYIHDLRGQMHEVEHGTGSWRTMHYIRRNGNLYPTHGLGPVAQYMGINRGDRFDYLCAMASPAAGRERYARANFPPDHKWNKVARWNCGDINQTLVRTALGRTILVQWDETSPRPYSRLNLIQGTRGTLAGFPNRLVIEGETRTHEWVEGDGFEKLAAKYEHPLWKKMGELAAQGGGHGGMDWLMLWRTVTCLRQGEPLDQDVYDAASWSAIGPLSEQSIARRSASIDVPDFTRGRWKSTPPLGIVTG